MINEMIRKNINVDKSNILPIFTFKEGDNAILKLALFKNSIEFDVTGQTLRLGAKTSKGLIEQLDGFTVDKNNIDIQLKNSILIPGVIEIDLEIKDAKGAMTTASFFITVNQKVLNDEAVEATNEFDTFTKTVDKIESDYTGLRRIIIDENQAANLQDQVNQTNAQLETIKTYITPEMFGAKGDGLTDDTVSIQTAIVYAINNKKVLKFKGKYSITSQLIVSDTIEIDLNGSEIIANYKIPNVFYFKKENGTIIGAKIRNGVINCNDVADNGINIYRATGGFYCDDIKIIKPLKHGVLGGTESDNSSYEIMVNRLTIDRESGSKYPTGSYGVYLDNVTDSRIIDTIIVGVENGVYINGGGSELIAVHVWNRPSNGFMKIGFDIDSDTRLISCYADSTEIGFNVRGVGNTLIAPKVYVNTYGEANGTNYPLNPICFDFHKESGKGNTIIGLIVGSGGDNGSIDFIGCKRNEEYQTFIGSKYASGFSFGSNLYYPACFRNIVEFKNKLGNNEVRVHNERGLQVNSLNPFNDNLVDIGSYYNRFKNLYLSGGVKVGTTSTENRPMYGADVKFLMHYDYDINRYIMWDGANWKEIPFDDVRHGNGSPWFVPLRIGQEYYDLQNKKLYKSFGTSMSDWVIVN